MAKIRVNQLAKELGVPAKEIIERLAGWGEYAKSSSAALEAPVVSRVRDSYAQTASDDPIQSVPVQPTSIAYTSKKKKGSMINQDKQRVRVESASKTAVFIDLENLTGMDDNDDYNTRGFLANSCNMDIASMFKALGGKRSIVLAAAYASVPVGAAPGAVVRDLRQLNVMVRDVPGYRPPNSNATMKDAADFQIYVDAMELAMTRPDVATFVIASRDHGYYALANKLKELGKTVVVAIPFGTGIGRVYRDRVDRVLCVKAIDTDTGQPVEPMQAADATVEPNKAIMAEISQIPIVDGTFGIESRLSYCAHVSDLFTGLLGAVVRAHGADGLIWEDMIAALGSLIPGGSPKSVSIASWAWLLRFALPEDFAIVQGDRAQDWRVVDADFIQGRQVETPVTLEDLGEPPALNMAIKLFVPLNTIPCVIEWCEANDGELTASRCYGFLQDDAGKSGITYSDIQSSMRTMVNLGFLREASRDLSSGLVARGVNGRQSPKSTQQSEPHYVKAPGFSESIVLQKIVDEVTSRAEAIMWPVGPKARAALDSMKVRIEQLSAGPSAMAARGYSSRGSVGHHTWDGLPDL